MVPDAFKISGPSERQIFQRNDKNRAEIPVYGKYNTANPPETMEICAELSDDAANGKSVDWQNVKLSDGEFNGTLELMAGGWYKICVRAKYGEEYVIKEITRVRCRGYIFDSRTV